jgi:hypothetical protein
MKAVHLKIIFCVLYGCLSASYMAQEPQTIRVKKESDLTKAVFDNTELKLIVVDRFGNPRENRIASYKLYVKGKHDTKEFSGYSNKLSPDMIAYLEKLSSASKIFFTEISAKDDEEHLVKLPDVIEVWFPDCVNCKSGKNQRR